VRENPPPKGDITFKADDKSGNLSRAKGASTDWEQFNPDKKYSLAFIELSIDNFSKAINHFLIFWHYRANHLVRKSILDLFLMEKHIECR
jgi:hypothetical protein